LSATAVLAAGLLLAACGSKSHENAPRQPLAQVVSVAVGPETIEVSPEIAGLPGRRPVNISQNADAPINQADPDADAVIQFAIANLIPRDTELILEGPVEAVEALTASGSGSFNKALPTGIYRLSSPDSTDTARFAVGPSRVSSNSDLLSP